MKKPALSSVVMWAAGVLGLLILNMDMWVFIIWGFYCGWEDAFYQRSLPAK